MNSTKSAKFRGHLDTVLKAAFVLDELPDNPLQWSTSEQEQAREAILNLGAPESFLRRFARQELLQDDVCYCDHGRGEGITVAECIDSGNHVPA